MQWNIVDFLPATQYNCQKLFQEVIGEVWPRLLSLWPRLLSL
jgi:hypothetical protein